MSILSNLKMKCALFCFHSTLASGFNRRCLVCKNTTGYLKNHWTKQVCLFILMHSQWWYIFFCKFLILSNLTAALIELIFLVAIQSDWLLTNDCETIASILLYKKKWCMPTRVFYMSCYRTHTHASLILNFSS